MHAFVKLRFVAINVSTIALFQLISALRCCERAVMRDVLLQVARLRDAVVWRLKESALLTDKNKLKKTHPDHAKCALPRVRE